MAEAGFAALHAAKLAQSSGDLDRAYGLYLQAIQEFMELARATADARVQRLLRQECAGMMDEAEALQGQLRARAAAAAAATAATVTAPAPMADIAHPPAAAAGGGEGIGIGQGPPTTSEPSAPTDEDVFGHIKPAPLSGDAEDAAGLAALLSSLPDAPTEMPTPSSKLDEGSAEPPAYPPSSVAGDDSDDDYEDEKKADVVRLTLPSGQWFNVPRGFYCPSERRCTATAVLVSSATDGTVELGNAEDGTPILIRRVPLTASNVQNFAASVRAADHLLHARVQHLQPCSALFLRPLVGPAKVEAVLHIPWPSGITLEQWLAGAREPGAEADMASPDTSLPCGHTIWAVQSVFQQLWQVLSVAHTVGICGWWDPRTIIVGPRRQIQCAAWYLPRVCCSAPEASSGSAPLSPAADVFTVASWLFKAYFGVEPVLFPDADSVRVPLAPGGAQGAHVTDLLSAALQRDPARRLTAHEASTHPGLATAAFVEGQIQSHTLISGEVKSRALEQMLLALKKEQSWRFSINRRMLVDTTITAFSEATREDLLKKTSVRFTGEDGVDAGGLTVELYQLFFESITGEHSILFECSKEAETLLYLPTPDNVELEDRERLFGAVGRVLIKCIFDQVPVPARFAPSMFKYLLGIKPNIQDLQAFDPVAAGQANQILRTAAEDLEMLFLSFSDVGEVDRPVTVANREEYVAKFINYTLVGCRKEALDALARGFRSIPLDAQLQLFSAEELMFLICGQQHVSAAQLAIGELTPEECRVFLKFVTSQSALPRNGQRIVIRKHADRAIYPTAHTCFRRLDMPDLADAAEIRRRIHYVLERADMAGFGIS